MAKKKTARGKRSGERNHDRATDQATITASLPKELIVEIRAAADRQSRTVSGYLRVTLTNVLKIEAAKLKQEKGDKEIDFLKAAEALGL